MKNVGEVLQEARGIKQILFATLIGTAVISFWRGVWGLIDIYLFPGNSELRFWIAVAAGISILISTHYLTKEFT